MRKIFFLTVISVVTFSGSSLAQWTQTNGPYGGNVRSIAASGSLLFAGTFNGIFISSNNGLEWHPGGLENKSISSLALVGENVFAAVYVGYSAPAEVYLTTDKGSNWELVTDGLNSSYVNSLAVSGTNILASTWDGLFLSSNNGTNWVKITNNLPAFTIFSLAVSENNILVSSYEKGIFISSDNGSNWNNLGLKNYGVHSMAMYGNSILAASYEAGVLLSSDKGSNWKKVNDLSYYINTIAVNGIICLPLLIISFLFQLIMVPAGQKYLQTQLFILLHLHLPKSLPVPAAKVYYCLLIKAKPGYKKIEV